MEVRPALPWTVPIAVILSAWLGFAFALWDLQARFAALEARLSHASDALDALYAELGGLRQAVEDLSEDVAPIDEALGVVSRLPSGPTRRRIALAVLRSAKAHGVDPLLVVSVGAVESNWKPDAVGRFGELGPLQILPDTCRYLRADCSHPHAQIDASVRYLSRLLSRSGRVEVAVARYHAGHNLSPRKALSRSRKYVRKVVATYQRLAGKAATPEGS